MRSGYYGDIRRASAGVGEACMMTDIVDFDEYFSEILEVLEEQKREALKVAEERESEGGGDND